MYADSVTPSMERAIYETNRRREIQEKYNKEHNITPKSITKKVADIIEISSSKRDKKGKKLTKAEKSILIDKLTKEMKQASAMLEFEHAAYLRDRIKELKTGRS